MFQNSLIVIFFHNIPYGMYTLIEKDQVVSETVEGRMSNIVPFKLTICDCWQFTPIDNFITAEILQVGDWKKYLSQMWPYLT